MVVAAIGRGGDWRKLASECSKYEVPVHVGSEDDVLSRYHEVANYYEADAIMRITGDCPLISPELCADIVSRVKAGFCDYASNVHPRTFPRGMDCEAFTMDLLARADREATTPYDREHVTPWMVSALGVRKNNVESPWPMEGRLCIDTHADYEVVKSYFDESGPNLRAA